MLNIGQAAAASGVLARWVRHGAEQVEDMRRRGGLEAPSLVIDAAQTKAAGLPLKSALRPNPNARLCMLMVRCFAHRLATTFVVVLSLLFSQLALASYVCPQQADVAAGAAMMEAGMPCGGMDMDQPALCAEHSHGAPQSFETVKQPAAAVPVVVQVLKLPLESDAQQARAVPWAATPEAQPPPDPLFLSTLRLRV